MAKFAHLRDRLRAETRAAHEALDTRVSALDLQTSAGLRGYLTMHATALAAIRPIAHPAQSCRVIEDIHARSLRDLATFGKAQAVHGRQIAGPLDPLAIDYVVLGSRLGSAVLKKRWQGSKDECVLAARAHFEAPTYLAEWRAFCDQTEHHTAIGPQADQIIKDADVLFDFYYQCVPTQQQRHADA